jgi:hypothetical protein
MDVTKVNVDKDQGQAGDMRSSELHDSPHITCWIKFIMAWTVPFIAQEEANIICLAGQCLLMCDPHIPQQNATPPPISMQRSPKRSPYLNFLD